MIHGIDGIKNKIHPGESFDKDLYELPPEEVKAIPTVCGSLREAMESLDKDREFLTQGGVFTDDQIEIGRASCRERVYKSLSNDLPGSILFFIPSIPAINIAANVKYGLPDASGNLISHLAPFLLKVIGILHEADLFLVNHQLILQDRKSVV